MGRGNVGWVGEVSAAADASYGFSHVILQPKRLTAYVDISKKLLAQDTVGVENAIRRDIVNALTDKLEATIFGSAAGDATKPAGIFYDSSIYDASTFAAVVANESKVEDNNVYGDMKYALSTSAKADLRAMPKSTKNTQLVMEGGQIDGVPAVVTSNIKTAGVYAYGDWSNLAVGSWGDIDITVDEYTQAVNGCVRLVVNAYFDAKKLRPEAFVFGKTRA
jgi:HK97 family phage major capsid protein